MFQEFIIIQTKPKNSKVLFVNPDYYYSNFNSNQLITSKIIPFLEFLPNW